ncbi:MAG: threonine--tRNA ligase [bacterium]|nr:threonine--tRNA ligase [bacterium]
MPKNQADIDHIRHSLSHLLAMAVLKKFPKAKLGIGPTIEHGFYYDFLFQNHESALRQSSGQGIKNQDLKDIEKEMKELIKRNLLFSGKKITAKDAESIFKNQPFKKELAKDFKKEKRTLTAYATCPPNSKFIIHNSTNQQNDCFVDLCKGGHVTNTNEINPDGFTLTKIAGAYWKGDEKKPQLTRIYGVAFASKKELDDYLAMQAEAERHDHKKLGPELDLFTFSELVGPGLPLWTPKGTLLRNILDDFVWELRKKAGYAQVDIPHITKKALYEKSGHWEKFQNELFKIETREGHIFAMKPMNCPHHTQIYARKLWSWRELPQRYASTTKVYRDEQSGELAGLSRVRAITQDDAHVFCRADQAIGEMEKIWDIITEFYKKCGFSDFTIRLSTHDPKHPKNYLGKPNVWKKTEAQLKELIAKKHGKDFVSLPEAAFYGPKIDFMFRDSLGRRWQLATIQLDMNLPERFDLYCIDEAGKKERIVMIHAAIMGSIERFLAILIEHTAGVFPFWLAPTQIQILTVNDKVSAYAESVKKELEARNIRVTLDDRNESIGKKIREAEMQKIPYSFILGEKEKDAGTISVRAHGKKDMGVMTLPAFLKQAEK